MGRLLRKRISKPHGELDVTTFLNLMVALIPFLLISAVFSRVAIMELSVPTGDGSNAAPDTPALVIEVIVRSKGLELSNGAQVVAALPKKEGKYDLEKLSKMLVRLKRDYPEKQDATILLEPNIEYDYLIRIMDILRSAQVKEKGDEEPHKLVLFPNISIGDAP